MSSVHAQSLGDDDADAPGPPILLRDIDRALRHSARVASRGSPAPVRAWRDELTVALESLVYARTVLSADVAILRHRLSSGPGTGGALADELSHAMSARPWGAGWFAPDDGEGPGASSTLDWDVFARSDLLMPAHEEMAFLDLSSHEDVARVIDDMEAQLSELTLRQEAVEVRLREIRAAIVGQYRDGAVTAEDLLG